MNKQHEHNVNEIQPFMVGPWHVVPATGQVYRENEESRLEPKAMEVLVYLAQHADQAVTRMDLEDSVWAGTVVSYDSLTVIINKIRKAFHDNSRQPEYVQTLAKKGYRLIAPVVFKPGASGDIKPGAATKTSMLEKRPRVSGAFFVVVLLLAVLTGGLIVLVESPEPAVVKQDSNASTSAVKMSIAVLPFNNISGDPKQNHFASGMTEYLITDLSRLSNLLVIARSSVVGYQGDLSDLQQVSKDLGVRYIMTGNVRNNRDMIRVTAQLVDSSNNMQLWADRFDRKVNDVISVQDELTRIIVSQLEITLTRQEEERFKLPQNKNFAAYELVLEGRKKHFQHTREANREAQQIYRQAIETDAEYARAYTGLSVSLSVQFRRGWTDSPMVVLDRARELALKAIELDPGLPQAYWALSYAHLYRQEYSEAAKVMQQGIDIAPGYADGYGLLSLIYNNLGESEKAMEMVKKGMRLNPYYTWDYPYNLGRAHYNKGEVDKAIPLLQEALERNENALFPRMFLAASFARRGQIEDANWEIEQILVLDPDMSLSKVERQHSIKHPDLSHAYLSDLKRAGLPD